MEEIIKQINLLASNRKVTFIAIDGMQGGGKTTLVKYIQKIIPDIQIIRMDDFYNPYQKDDDHRRVKTDALQPLKRGEVAQFKIYDWIGDKVVDSKPITPTGIIIVEGIYSMEKELVDFYNLKIWVDCPSEVGLQRGLARDNDANKDLWETKWIPQTISYIEEQKPYLKADIVINYKDILV